MPDHTPQQNADLNQREALKQSEHDATVEQPENFKDRAIDDKIVEIGSDKTKAPIKGLDTPEHPGGGR